MDKYFYHTYRYLRKHPFYFGVGLFLLFGILISVATRISFEEDISKLIPTTSENEQLQKVLNTVDFSDKIIVNIQKKQEGATEDLTEYASLFIDSLNATSADYIKDVQGKLAEDTALETLDFVYDNAPLFLTEVDYALLESKLPADSIAEITAVNYKTLASPSGLVAKEIIVKDPLGISLLGIEHFKQLGLNDEFILKEGFLVSKSEQNLLLFITPTYATSETDKNELFVTQLYKLQEKLNEQFVNKAESEYYGGALIAVANAQQIKSDIQFTVSIALTVLLLLFILFYRKFTIPIILFVPTIFGGLLSVAFLYLYRGEISAISLGIGSVLLGVTLDYSLHILTHIRNNETIQELYLDVVKPILMSSLTTALAFLCLLFINSQALQDLGLFAAVSVLGASVFALIFIPQVYKGKPTEKTKKTILDRFAAYSFQKNKLVIGFIVLVTIVSIFTYNKVEFNNDLSQLNYEPEALKKAEKNLDSLTNATAKSLYITTFGNSLEQALEENDKVYQQLNVLQTEGDIIRFNSIAALINSEKRQLKKIEKWDQFWNTEVKTKVKTDLIASGKPFGFKTTTHQEFYRLLDEEFNPISIDQYQNIGSLAINDFIASEENFNTVTSLVKVDDAKSELVKNTFVEYKNTLVIDRQAMNELLLGNLKDEFNTLIFYCLGVVFLLLLLFYRNLKVTLVTIIPIMGTWFITVGLMGFFNLQFNIFNVIISTFIFGLGVDYSIFITNGLLKQQKTNVNTLATHKTSILLSVITTLLGVGVLIFAKHPALYSISLVTIIGIFSAMLIAFTIQPLLFNLLIFNKKKSTT